MKKMRKERVRDRAMGCLMGVFIGDAFGLPVECQSPAAICDKFGYLDYFASNKHHKFKNVARRAAGTKSDDSQLSLAMMSALRQGYDLWRIRREHVEAANGKWGEPVGWGGTTRKAVEKMKAGDRVTSIEGGAGNGTCMKIAPLAIYCVYKCRNTPHGRFTNSFNASLLKKCREITLLTHPDPNCVVATYCQARMIIRAMQGELPRNSVEIAKWFLVDAKWAEDHLTRAQFVHIDSKVQTPSESLHQRMKELFCRQVTVGDKTLNIFSVETSAVSIGICTERSSWILHSYPLVAYCTAKYLPLWNFKHAVLETANAGADADSNASMVAAIAGAYLGLETIPTEMVRGLKEATLLLKEARDFEQSL